MSDSRDHELPEGRLEERFVSKASPLTPGAAHLESNRCLFCFDAPCIPACPTEIDIPTFIRKIATGNVTGSARTILTSNLLGASCSRVCPVEVLCEGACVYNEWDKPPIQIGQLQRYAMDHGASPDLLEKAAPSGFSVGLVGAGPASLACAGTLALLGHETILYERDELPGGLNTTGVAPYKMNARRSILEVDFIRRLGVTIRTGVEIGVHLSGEDLLKQHGAVFLGPGLGKDSGLGVPGEEGAGVVGAVEWIYRMKLDRSASVEGIERAAVIGGGNTAIDVVRELAQLGVPQVRLIYRRSESDMKGYVHEWNQAKREGVVLVPNAVVTGIEHNNGRVARLALVRARDGKPTQEALAPHPADLVVLAIGQTKLRDLVRAFPGAEVDERGRIVADPETGVTGNPKVFAGGDARNGGKEVVNAADEGQKAARAIDRMLRGATTHA